MNVLVQDEFGWEHRILALTCVSRGPDETEHSEWTLPEFETYLKIDEGDPTCIQCVQKTNGKINVPQQAIGYALERARRCDWNAIANV